MTLTKKNRLVYEGTEIVLLGEFDSNSATLSGASSFETDSLEEMKAKLVELNLHSDLKQHEIYF